MQNMDLNAIEKIIAIAFAILGAIATGIAAIRKWVKWVSGTVRREELEEMLKTTATKEQFERLDSQHKQLADAMTATERLIHERIDEVAKENQAVAQEGRTGRAAIYNRVDDLHKKVDSNQTSLVKHVSDQFGLVLTAIGKNKD